MQSYTASIANTVAADMVAKADGTPITTGTVTFYLIAKTGVNAGKWFQTSDDSWQATESAAGTGTHTSDGHWTCSIDAAAWLADTRYSLYAKESGDLHIPYSEEVCDPTLSNVTKISGDSDAADNLELMYDGTGYVDDTAPASRSQVTNIVTTGAATHKSASSATITTGSQTGTYANTSALDGVYHQIDIAGDEIDLYYEFDVGTTGVGTSVSMTGRLYDNTISDTIEVYAYNWGGTTWEQIGSIESIKTSDETYNFTLFTQHVGTGTDDGKIRIRFYNTNLDAGTILYIDQLYTSYATVGSSVGYANGAIWVDTVNGVAGTTDHVNGVADNPVNSWADAVTLATSLGMNKFEIASGSSITLTGDSSNYHLEGRAWTLALNGQTITDAHFFGARVSGIGVNTGTPPVFEQSGIGAVTLGPAKFENCGFGRSSGAFTAGSAGQFIMHNCFSLVPGSGSPSFDFSGMGTTTGINNRGWCGGFTCTLDSDCILSHEVLAGGGVTLVTGGGDAEIRGICRSLDITVADAETVQFVGVTGPITLNDDGASTATINLYGVSSSVTDNTNGATVTDATVSNTDIETIDANVDLVLEDTAELQGNQGNWLTATGFATSGELSSHDGKLDTVDANVDLVLEDTAELQGNQGNWLTATGFATSGALSTHDSKLDTVDANVDLILEDTGTTIPATITTLQGTATKLEGMFELDGAVYKFTANALEEAPSGTGGDATLANQTSILEDIEDMKGTGFVKDTNSLVDLTATTPINVTVETTVVE